MTLDDWLARIERLHHRPIDMTLERARAVAQRLGIDLSPAVVFTVGGTNGKGSTCALLESMLRADGYRVGLYTSPHLLRFNERVRIDGEEATDAALIEQFEAVEAARQDISLTFFEFTTLAGLRLFQQARLDAIILEVGLGGRLDTVNLVDADCAVITSIALDHQEFLGDTIETIGFEKAHIYRRDRPAICAEPKPPQALLDVAEQIGADLWLIGRDFSYNGDRAQWNYRGRGTRRASLPYPALRGDRQLQNAAAALAALEACATRLPISQKAVREGLLTAQIAARFQVLPGRPSVILDVAHNPAAATVLARNLVGMGFFPVTHAVFGMLGDKDIAGVVAQVAPLIDCWHVGSTDGPRGSSSERTAAIVRAAPNKAKGASVEDCGSMTQAFERATERAAPEDRILVFGSFLTVAEILARISSNQRTSTKP